MYIYSIYYLFKYWASYIVTLFRGKSTTNGNATSKYGRDERVSDFTIYHIKRILKIYYFSLVKNSTLTVILECSISY